LAEFVSSVLKLTFHTRPIQNTPVQSTNQSTVAFQKEGLHRQEDRALLTDWEERSRNNGEYEKIMCFWTFKRSNFTAQK